MQLTTFSKFKKALKNGTDVLENCRNTYPKPPVVKDEEFAYGILIESDDEGEPFSANKNDFITVVEGEIEDGDRAIIHFSDGTVKVADLGKSDGKDFMWINILSQKDGKRSYESLKFNPDGSYAFDEKVPDDPNFELRILSMHKVTPYLGQWEL